jgi:putative peptide zinc metalloprotease protein
MVSLADSLVASSSRPLGLRMRADLTARRHRYQGRSYWVVKDPVGLRYFRFQEEEFAVLNMMREGASLNSIKEKFEKQFAPHKITLLDLQHFVGTLHRSGLVVSDAPGQGKQLKKRADERAWKEFLGKLSNVLSIRFKGIDPDKLLNFLYRYTRWMFTTTAAIGFGLVALAALTLIAVQFDVFRSRLPAFDQFFGPTNWGYLIVVLAVTKILHEFGHGLLCKHFGGECHEMGMMMLVLTPCLYCNVSDSWMLPNKWHRAAIGAGGIYIELILASFATFIWWFSEPGLLNHLALRVMFICSISTVLFNGNPLLRFDGYYILSDLLEIPNLRQKSTRILQQIAAKWCLGIDMPEDPFLPQRNHFAFALFTIAAVAYRWFVFFSVLFFLNQVFEPYGLKILGRMIAVTGIVGLVVQPIWALGKFFYIPGRMDQVKWPRVYITAGVAASILAAVLFIPIPRNVPCAVQIQLRDAADIYVSVPGSIEEVYRQPGETVKAGEKVLRLWNQELEMEMQQIRSQISELMAKKETLRRVLTQEGGSDNAAAELARLDATIHAKEAEFKEREKRYQRLVLKAPKDGMLLEPPLRPERTPPEGELAGWSGSPFDPQNNKVFLEVNDIVGQVGNKQELQALLAIDQADIEVIHVGQPVKIVLSSATGTRLAGTIEKVARREMSVAPTSLSNSAGGGVPTRKNLSGQDVPLDATFVATVPLDNPDGTIQPGFRGIAKVRSGFQTLGSRFWRYLMKTFHFEI